MAGQTDPCGQCGCGVSGSGQYTTVQTKSVPVCTEPGRRINDGSLACVISREKIDSRGAKGETTGHYFLLFLLRSGAVSVRSSAWFVAGHVSHIVSLVCSGPCQSDRQLGL